MTSVYAHIRHATPRGDDAPASRVRYVDFTARPNVGTAASILLDDATNVDMATCNGGPLVIWWKPGTAAHQLHGRKTIAAAGTTVYVTASTGTAAITQTERFHTLYAPTAAEPEGMTPLL